MPEPMILDGLHGSELPRNNSDWSPDMEIMAQPLMGAIPRGLECRLGLVGLQQLDLDVLRREREGTAGGIAYHLRLLFDCNSLSVWRESPQLEIKQLLQARQRLHRVPLFVGFKDQSDRQPDHARDSSTPRFDFRNGSFSPRRRP